MTDQIAIAGREVVLAGMPDVPCLDPQEFIDTGYLQEVNRQFLHPLGLALEVSKSIRVSDPRINNGEPAEIQGRFVFFVRVWDYREDAEGIRYEGGLPDPAKAAAVEAILEERVAGREAALGYWVQPVE